MTTTDLSLSTSDAVLDTLNALRDFDERILRKVSREVLPPIERLIARKFAVQPPPRVFPGSPTFVWSLDPQANARARRWFFANYPNGYERTGALAQNWRVNAIVSRDTLTIAVENDANAASFVYGNDTFQQIPGHQTTGWLDASDTFVEAAAEFEQTIIRFIDEEIEQL